jgi:hypothetical protein
MPPKTPSKGSKIISKPTKGTASKSGATAVKKSNKRKRMSSFDTFINYVFYYSIGKETYSIYIYKVLKQVRIVFRNK